MEDDTDRLFYLGSGAIAAIILGMALVPVREFTAASNLTFVFLALTIVVAELGGRWAAVVTALASSLSLDFFLTKPYLSLRIEDKHDVIAFVGLTVCGLIAAALGSQRGRRLAQLASARKDLDLLHFALGELAGTAAAEEKLSKVLNAAKEALPVAALVLRDERGYILAASQRESLRPAPGEILDLGGSAFPEKGGRIALVAGKRQVGWLDVWGDEAAASAEARRTLSDLARLLGLWIGSNLGTDERAPA